MAKGERQGQEVMVRSREGRRQTGEGPGSLKSMLQALLKLMVLVQE